ncbi:MAG: hypothetical protein AAGI71_15845 [Bacteroidota bacterium]
MVASLYRLGRLLVLAGLLSATALTAAAQSTPPRIGVGFSLIPSISEGLGLGLFGRVSSPLNSDISVAVGGSLTGFVLSGRDDASYAFDPQLSLIITLPEQGNQAPYVLGGVGAFVPIRAAGRQSGPTLHFGFGWVRLLNETSGFLEINPALVIGDADVDLVLPVRAGLIF